MKKIKQNTKWAAMICITLSIVACSNEDSASDSSITENATVPAVFSSNYKTAVTLSSDGTSLTLKSNGTPDHVTPYWGTGHALMKSKLPER
jgi:hypothetical protein